MSRELTVYECCRCRRQWNALRGKQRSCGECGYVYCIEVSR